ncbi:mycothiol system anti-sigma-R factor [Nocardioides sp. TF02-7]|uniref:mycothiol system anti-sigma-R factor n=1 Tax=Nocardioides sp. TF02-7 TaxID=2917724 RepID=UPI001F0540AC|nr:mycothiol system anti-sigma-R factor [Nocardioides sp. TF02-7]UMG91943.1 mycothiol system anti-sigma-R factor [Nocardioides sp. TF02-7]
MSHEHGRPGQHTDEECVDFLERIVRLIDNELEEGECAVVRAHLEGCNPCLERYDLQRTVKALVARSCSEKAPADLREKVRVQIQAVQVRITEG